ncbi:FAD-binding domain-containing protein [Westerdykella ornata]|uniref:FAD-binding domain-containing protein n=1 Tax=Westerdykella ornata TaxID=318751 RepID=A0A6A6JV32_WESOR|nr:FAD-binding domain-containing protein [Westerdykella ornata]KAF2280452.1 FAD-binding domain-containing protein [Westerdykella ornata]
MDNHDPLFNILQSTSVPYSIPDSPEYDSLRLPYNLRLQPKPAVIVFPQSIQQISLALKAASEAGLKVQARSGGHSYASFGLGGKDGSMVIDLREFQDVETLNEYVDPSTGEFLRGVVAKVGGGARLGNMARKLFQQGKRALPHGTGSGVGIGGHSTLGGYGYVSRAWGLALDRIVAVDVVLADGRVLHANLKENENVFWAVRGAAHSIGIVATFYMKTEEAPLQVIYFELGWDGMYEDMQRFTNTFLEIQHFATESGVVDERLTFGVRVDGSTYRVTGGFLGGEDEFNDKILPALVKNLPAPSSTSIKPLGWIEFLEVCSDKGTLDVPAMGTDEHKSFYATSLTVSESEGLTEAAMEAFFEHITSPPLPEKYFIIINLHGGSRSSINNKDEAFSAYTDRDSLWTFQIPADSDTAESKDFVMGIRNKIIEKQKGTSFGASLSYIDAALSREEAWKAYYRDQEVVERLKKIKREVDPRELFWNPHAITAIGDRRR